MVTNVLPETIGSERLLLVVFLMAPVANVILLTILIFNVVNYQGG